MGLFKKRSDPISARSRALNAEIAALEAKIKKLDTKLHPSRGQPRLRSTARPHRPSEPPVQRDNPDEPIFESVDRQNVPHRADSETTPQHYNDLGVRKYDLIAAWRRFQNHFRGPPAGNPKLVNYLAAGSIKGLRPLRYEKRVARNRFLVSFIVLICLLLGFIKVFLYRH